MSDVQAREAIAAAANTVEGVNISPWYRQSTKAGDGFVSLSRSERDSSGFGFMNKWEVLVALPQDLRDAEKRFAALVDGLVEAVAAEIVVTAFYPSNLSLDTALVPCFVIEGSRARD